jgi:AcrR family transcriptional regulator
MARVPDLEKRRDLCRRAARVLEEEGLQISSARLADALGIKRPTLLYHFPTHSHVIEAALEELLIEQAAYVLARIHRHEHPIDRLYAQLRAVHAFHDGREARVVFLSQAIAASAGPRLREILARASAVFEPYRRAMADDLRAGIAAGTVAPCDPDALVALVRGLVDGLLIQRVTSGLDLGTVHALVWEGLLAPLKLSPLESHAGRPRAGGSMTARSPSSPRRSSARPSTRAASRGAS